MTQLAATDIQSSSTKCIACCADIPVGATKCNSCSAFQTKWKNTLAYFSAIAGGLSLIAAAAAFVVSSWDTLRKVVAWKDDVAVVQLKSSFLFDAHDITVANTGDGEIVLLGLTYRTAAGRKYGVAKTIHLSESILPGKAISTSSTVPRLPESDRTATFSAVWTTSPVNCEDAMNAFWNKSGCATLAVYTPEHPVFQNISNTTRIGGNSLCTFDFDGILSAFSPKSRKVIDSKVALKGVVFYDFQDPRCVATANPAVQGTLRDKAAPRL